MTASFFQAQKLFLHEIIHNSYSTPIQLFLIFLSINYFTDKILKPFSSLLSASLLDWDIAEYGCMLRITEKSDVYSFGVVLLEIITGKRPIDASFAEEGQHVIGWVREKLKRKKDPFEIVDSKLQGHPDTQIQEMLQALGIALLCTSHRAEDRPTMKDVAALLREIKHDPSLAEAHKPTATTTNSNSMKTTSQASSYSSSPSLSVTPAQLLLLQPSSHSSSLAYSSSSVAGYHPAEGNH